MAGATSALSSTFPPLVRALSGDRAGLLRPALLMVLGTVALWVSAKVQIPFYPVPMTLQTLVVLAIGAAYGWRLGAATVALYLIEGAAGLPVFAYGGGAAYFAGPTGGFLIGFFFAAALVGALAERGWDRNPASMAAAMLFGNAVIYLFGLAWFSHLKGFDAAVEWAFAPYLLGDMLKIAVATLAFPALWRLINQR